MPSMRDGASPAALLLDVLARGLPLVGIFDPISPACIADAVTGPPSEPAHREPATASCQPALGPLFKNGTSGGPRAPSRESRGILPHHFMTSPRGLPRS